MHEFLYETLPNEFEMTNLELPYIPDIIWPRLSPNSHESLNSLTIFADCWLYSLSICAPSTAWLGFIAFFLGDLSAGSG